MTESSPQITAVWSINQNRNSWVGVGGIGWKRLANNSDSAIVALTMLSAHAREKASVVNYRNESDGMIHEMYVWYDRTAPLETSVKGAGCARTQSSHGIRMND